MSQSFTTSFGREIPFIDGYRNAHRHTTKCLISDFSDEEIEKKVSKPVTYTNFRKDLVEYVLVMDFLQSIGVTGPWKNSLDVGGREATIARLLKGEKRAENSETIDVVPCHKQLNLSTFMKYFKEVYTPKRGPFRIPRRFAGLFDKKYYNWAYSQNLEFGFSPHRFFGWDIKLHQTPEADAYIVDDFMTYDFGKQYDFICSFLTVMYFDPDEMFQRVYDLLEPGGVFVFLVDYWWFPVNSMDIIGDFPYASQRLTKEDMVRYFQEFHPEDADAVARRYDSHHNGNHQTLASYALAAEKHGLSVIGEQRCVPREETGNRTPLMPYTLDQYDNSAAINALEDIKQFRDDVTLLDLKTPFVMMAFEKRSERKPDLKERIDELPSINYGRYKRYRPGEQPNEQSVK